jgi:hypothetical protein
MKNYSEYTIVTCSMDCRCSSFDIRPQGAKQSSGKEDLYIMSLTCYHKDNQTTLNLTEMYV